uniref:coiled-coil domain-containing protein 113-like isoform X2 n=1 Tax=Gasterosteus aculeatus aculeatus TaxID=481459 RepID=UPI001A99B547|nr:coiled-coil domain-containing protein 113-like isoform X2 [Gasterosteus aculeatus aculeatus]
MEDELSLTEEQEVAQEQKELHHDQVEALKCSNAALLAEIDMLERFIGRIDPQDLVSTAGGDGLGPAGASNLEGGLTSEQKLYVAQREVTEARADLEKARQRCERVQDHYKASLEEAEWHLADIRKAKKKFESKALKPLQDKRLEVKEPEKVLQYIKDKSKVAQIEKFHLKNRTLQAYKKKLQQQLQQKKETGKAEYEDLFQEYCEQRIDKSLEELAVNHSKVLRVLGSHKEKLQSVTAEAAQLSDDITNRKQLLVKIEEKLQQAEEERSKAEALNKHLRRQMTDYRAPDVTQYMDVKDRHTKLRRSIHMLERRSGITEQLALKGRSTLRTTLTPAGRAGAGNTSGGQPISLKLPHIAAKNTARTREAESLLGS